MIAQTDLVCFGELLWDNLPSGRVAGGAPYNIVNRATALGLEAYVISSVGKDAAGQDLLSLVSAKHNSTSFIQRHPSLPTGQVNIELGSGGEPKYDIVYPVAWDDIKKDQRIIDLVASSKSFIYSSLALRDPRSRSTLFELLPHASLKICDINLRNGQYQRSTIMDMVRYADILRTNEFELQQLAVWHDIDNLTLKEQLIHLYQLYNFDCILSTLGEEGAVAYYKDTWFVQPVIKVDVRDTVGAGDGFLAAFTSKLLSNESMQECLLFGCAVGALTASKSGGTPLISMEEIETILENKLV